ncbi:MAG: hypothetical protein ABFD97_17270, partial [Syntrophobacter sp.]
TGTVFMTRDSSPGRTDWNPFIDPTPSGKYVTTGIMIFFQRLKNRFTARAKALFFGFPGVTIHANLHPSWYRPSVRAEVSKHERANSERYLQLQDRLILNAILNQSSGGGVESVRNELLMISAHSALPRGMLI